jgi:hypothetical protein
VREAALGYLEVLAKEHKEIPRTAFHNVGQNSSTNFLK